MQVSPIIKIFKLKKIENDMGSQKYECDKCGRTFNTKEACEVHEEHCNGKEQKEEKKKSGGRGVLLFFILLIIILGIWGFIGGAVAQDTGVTCDMGIGDTFCWIWHKNFVGQVEEGINNLFGS